MSADHNQSTIDEIDFAKSVGKYIYYSEPGAQNRKGVPASTAHRITILKRYLEAMKMRVDWGRIDPNAVRAEVEKLVAELETSTKKGGL